MVSNSTRGLTSSADSFAVARGQSEGVPACTLRQLRAHREPLHLAPVGTARPRLPCQVLAPSPGRREAKHAAGTERVTASLIYLPRVKQTLPPALDVDCGVSQSGPVGSDWDHCVVRLSGTSGDHAGKQRSGFSKRYTWHYPPRPQPQAAPLLGLHPTETQTFVHTDSCRGFCSGLVHNSQKIETTPMSPS